MATEYRFSFGPWNISEGADPFGPEVRSPFSMQEKFDMYRPLGFEGVGQPRGHIDGVRAYTPMRRHWDREGHASPCQRGVLACVGGADALQDGDWQGAEHVDKLALDPHTGQAPAWPDRHSGASLCREAPKPRFPTILRPRAHTGLESEYSPRPGVTALVGAGVR